MTAQPAISLGHIDQAIAGSPLCALGSALAIAPAAHAGPLTIDGSSDDPVGQRRGLGQRANNRNQLRMKP